MADIRGLDIMHVFWKVRGKVYLYPLVSLIAELP